MKRSENRYINYALWRLWDIQHFCAGVMAAIKTELRFRAKPDQTPHTLPGKLIVSLSSHPPRFKYLERTLKSLLTQSMKPDHVILWIGEKNMQFLPPEVLALKDRGLEIIACNDTGPFTKLVPALQQFPDAFKVTADDDVYYSPEWLAMIINAWDGTNSHFPAHHGYYVTLDENGHPTPCITWKPQYDETLGKAQYFQPLGESGILYPPHSLHHDVTNDALYKELSHNADDFWFYWMARLNGARYTKVKPDWTKINWPGSQAVGLFKAGDLHVANDRRIANLVKHYGWPV